MSESEIKSIINLLKHIQVVLFTENGRLLYQFKQQATSASLTAVPVPEAALAINDSIDNTDTKKQIKVNNCNNNYDNLRLGPSQQPYSINDANIKIQPTTNRANVQSQKSALSALSECIFGSVSIQSLPSICVSKIHQLDVNTIMMSLVFEVHQQHNLRQQPQHQQQSTRVQKHQRMLSLTPATSSDPSLHQQKQNQNQHTNNHNTKLPLRKDAKIKSSNCTFPQQQSIRKKLGLALIWDSIKDQLDESDRTLRDFTLDYSKAIDFHLNLLKDSISNMQALSSKSIHTSVLNCLQSINDLANSSFVSNLRDFTEDDFVEEFISLIEELELKSTNYTMSTILSVLLSCDQLQNLQIVVTSQSPDTKILIMRILFVVRCLMFDRHLALFTSYIDPTTNIRKINRQKQNDDSHLYNNSSIVIKDSNIIDFEDLPGAQVGMPHSRTCRSLLNDSRVLPRKTIDNQFLSNQTMSKNCHVLFKEENKGPSNFESIHVGLKVKKVNHSSMYANGEESSTTMLAKSKLYMREYQSLRFSGPSSLPHTYCITNTLDDVLSRSASGIVTTSLGSTRSSPPKIASDLVPKHDPSISYKTEDNIDKDAHHSRKNNVNQIVVQKNNSSFTRSSSSYTCSTTNNDSNILNDQQHLSIKLSPVTEGMLIGFALLSSPESTLINTISNGDSRTSHQDETQRRKGDPRYSFADSSISATSGMFEFIKDPRVFQTKPLIYLPPSYPTLSRIYEPVTTSNYLISCALQCIITDQKELVNKEIALASRNDRILHIDCDNWSTKMFSCGAFKDVELSLALMDVCNIMKKMKLFKVDTKIIIEYFYSKVAEESPNAYTNLLFMNDLPSTPGSRVVADFNETCL